ncbi:alanine:cation symporter family protein, partial [Stenotrophomonas sp. 3diitr2024]|uniref:alanine:cation symporter family protein n=1 Tax=Stenotrophomonas sp. 3diitr2024 TaxID=3345115 RepID=UPI0035CBCBBD
RVVSNVAAGVRPTDAVNVQQMDDRFKAEREYTDGRFNAMVGAAFGAAGQRCMAASTLVLVGEARNWVQDLVEKAMGLKWYALAFAIATIIAAGFLMPGVQANAIADSII